MLQTYIIRGYTSRDPDFSFEYTSDSMLCANAIKNALLANVKKGTDWRSDILATDGYCFSMDEERSDLRDNDSQRVYLFEGHEECDGDDRQTYMVTIDPK